MRRFMLILGWLAASIADRGSAQPPAVQPAVVQPPAVQSNAPLTPVPRDRPAVSIDELPVAAKQGAGSRFALAQPLGEALESAFTVMPLDAEAGFLMRGKHLAPHNPNEAPQWVAIEQLQQTPFDSAKEATKVPYGLFETVIGGFDQSAEPIGAYLQSHDVAWTAQSIRKIVNMLQIGFSGHAEAYVVVAFREPIEPQLFTALRPQTKGIVRCRGVEVIKYEPESIKRMREMLLAGNGPGGPIPNDGERCIYLASLAPNVIALFESEKQADEMIGQIIDGNTFALRRPAWLTWNADTTFVGFNTFPNRGQSAPKGTLAQADPNARGIVIHWSPTTPQRLSFLYLTDQIDLTPRFIEVTKNHDIYGFAKYTPHPQGVSGTMELGATLPGGRHPLDAAGMCFSVVHLCGMIVMP